MKIYTDSPEGATVVQNAFIDRYMPHASGEFVKVYLYLLRCADTEQELSLCSIADALDHTEKDIRRALTYWEKQNLLRLKLSPEGTLQCVTFSSFREDPAERASQPEAGIAEDPQKIRHLFFIAEQYLGRALTSREQSDLIYYCDTLHFSVDLIDYLLDYCISKGSDSPHYIRKVALSWAEAGISTVAQARQETNLYNKNFFTVLKAFGIKGRHPALSEQETMTRWFDEYGFSIEVVLEACRRTTRKTGEPSFDYADGILRQWHENGVSSLKDISRLDQQHKEEQKKTPARQAKASAPNRFNNFSQRPYDYGQLEKLLNQ